MGLGVKTWPAMAMNVTELCDALKCPVKTAAKYADAK